jgi:hypothetical protein
MIGRLLGAAGTLLAAICVATVAAQAILLGYLWSRGKLTERTVTRAIAAANGAELPGTSSGALGSDQPTSDAEQPSLDDLARARAVHSRDIELREQALGDNLAMVKSEYAKLIDEKDRYERIKAAFRAQLDTLREGTLANNRETARQILEKIKPKQAKDQVLRMVKDGQLNDVVLILSQMPSAQRAKLIGEFKTDAEAETLAEILKLIREGVPETALIDDTEQKLNQADEAARPAADAAP